MNPSEVAADGFFLALHLVDSFGVDYDRDVLLNRLAEMARGGTSAFNSPEEELATLERQRSNPASPEERAEFLREFANRADIDLNFRLTASRVMEIIQRDHGTT